MDFGHFHRTLESCLHPDLQQFFLLKYNQLATVGGIFLTATPDYSLDRSASRRWALKQRRPTEQ